jgi:hypothetical protein
VREKNVRMRTKKKLPEKTSWGDLLRSFALLFLLNFIFEQDFEFFFEIWV